MRCASCEGVGAGSLRRFLFLTMHDICQSWKEGAMQNKTKILLLFCAVVFVVVMLVTH